MFGEVEIEMVEVDGEVKYRARRLHDFLTDAMLEVIMAGGEPRLKGMPI